MKRETGMLCGLSATILAIERSCCDSTTVANIIGNLNTYRNAFDEDRVPALYEDEAILQDIHSVASLLKMYFRELPNPLCTYQLYHTFVNAVQSSQEEGYRLLRMRDAVQKLPPPHYRYICKVA
jgi:hypothetical protein